MTLIGCPVQRYTDRRHGRMAVIEQTLILTTMASRQLRAISNRAKDVCAGSRQGGVQRHALIQMYGNSRRKSATRATRITAWNTLTDQSRPGRLGMYQVHKKDHLFVIGDTEIKSENLSLASVRSALERLSISLSVRSGFAKERLLAISTQLRPNLPANLPAVHVLGERCMQVNGPYRHGFFIAPAMLDVVLEPMERDHSADRKSVV